MSEPDVMTAKELYFWDTESEFPMCGCGQPEDVLALVRDALELLRDEITVDRMKRLEVLCADRKDELFYLLLYTFDHAGLIEHGTSVYGSWLSEHGRRLLGGLRAHGCDSDAWRLDACGASTYDAEFAQVKARWDKDKHTAAKKDLP